MSQNRRLTIEFSVSENEGSVDDQMVIQEQLAALKRAHSLSPWGLEPLDFGSKHWMMRQGAQRSFQAEVYNCLLFLAQAKGGVGKESVFGPAKEVHKEGAAVPVAEPHPSGTVTTFSSSTAGDGEFPVHPQLGQLGNGGQEVRPLPLHLQHLSHLHLVWVVQGFWFPSWVRLAKEIRPHLRNRPS